MPPGLQAQDHTGELIAAQNQLHNEEMQLARDQLAWGKDLAQTQMGQNQQYMDHQMRIANANEARASDQWDEYRRTWRPVEREYQQRILSYDTPERRERNAAEAAADVSRAFDVGEDNRRRTMFSYGIDPSSGRFAEQERTTGIERAKAASGASNAARRNTELQGISMLQGGSNFGRGLPSTGLAADQLAMSGVNSAAGLGIQGANSAINARSSALPWYAAAGGSLNQAANAANQYYNTYARSYGDTLNYNMQSKGIVNGWVGNIANMIGGGMGFSSEEFKEDKRPVDGDRVVVGIQAIPIKSYKYKAGIADEGHHVGPMAEDVREQFGDRVAPGGKLIDFQSLHGIELAGIASLANRLDRIEQSIGIARGERRAPTTLEGIAMMDERGQDVRR